jgi:hypothetical protein
VNGRFASEILDANADKTCPAIVFSGLGSDTNVSSGELLSLVVSSFAIALPIAEISVASCSSSVVGAFGELSSKEWDESYRESTRVTDGSVLSGRVDAIILDLKQVSN